MTTARLKPKSLPEPGAVLGQVRELWRYPVKSMQGERLGAVTLDETGLVGDRRWAVRDGLTGLLLHGRTTRPLLRAVARLEGGRPVITLPEGEELRGLGAETDAALSAWLGRPVGLIASAASETETAPFIEIPTDATFAGWTEESRRSIGPRGALGRMRAKVTDGSSAPVGADNSAQSHVLVLPSLPGTFNDCEAVHLLSEAELATGREALPDGQWDRHRFRPNLLVRDGSGRADELQWVGWRLAVGEVELDVTEPTLRCGMTIADQPGLDKDPRILGTLARLRGAYLGRYARVVRPGTIGAGDPITFLGAGEAVDLALFAFYSERIRS